jgi:hypothetical protein
VLHFIILKIKKIKATYKKEETKMKRAEATQKRKEKQKNKVNEKIKITEG